MSKAALTSKAPRKISMTPPYPGDFIRDEILNQMNLSVSKAAPGVEASD